MKFSGQQALKTPPSRIWDQMLDPDNIIKLTPEVSTIQEIKPDHYKISTHIKVGFIKKKFTGLIVVERMIPGEQFKLHITQESPIGSVKGECQVVMEPINEHTKVAYYGDLQMDGLIGRIGMPIVQKMINPIINNFLKEIDEKLAQI